ncbi:MAG: flagellar basal body protein [Hyphomicrobium sp.]|nr:flagellar basal body protein [Hyphomicrobium sp.]
MSPLNFFNVASRHAEWASVRRTVVATNIANVNTPGYKARDVEKFSIESAQFAPGLAATRPEHFSLERSTNTQVSSTFDAGRQEYHSGNNISLDRELSKLGSTSREQNLNAGLMKAFNRLISLSTRG